MERLDKFLTNAGVATRSQVKAILKTGRVCVDGKPVKDGAAKIDPEKQTVTLDGDEFILSAGFLSLKAARREPFRIVDEEGEAEQAILVVDQKGRASLLFRAKEVAPEQ